MKSIQLYEASDIDFKEPVHGWLLATILVIMLTPPDKEMDPEEWIKTQVAVHLNSANKSGISIAPREVIPDVPEVFR